MIVRMGYLEIKRFIHSIVTEEAALFSVVLINFFVDIKLYLKPIDNILNKLYQLSFFFEVKQ